MYVYTHARPEQQYVTMTQQETTTPPPPSRVALPYTSQQADGILVLGATEPPPPPPARPPGASVMFALVYLGVAIRGLVAALDQASHDHIDTVPTLILICDPQLLSSTD